MSRAKQPPMRIYNQHGQTTSKEDREKMEEDFNNRLLRQINHLPKASTKTGIKSQSPISPPLEQSQSTFDVAVSDYVRRRIEAKSAKLRRKSHTPAEQQVSSKDSHQPSDLYAESTKRLQASRKVSIASSSGLMDRSKVLVLPAIVTTLDDEKNESLAPSQNLEVEEKTQENLSSEGTTSDSTFISDSTDKSSSRGVDSSESSPTQSKEAMIEEVEVIQQQHPDDELRDRLAEEFGDCSGRKGFGLNLAVSDFAQKVLGTEGLGGKLPSEERRGSVVRERRGSAVSCSSRRGSVAMSTKNFQLMTPVEKLRRAVKTIALMLKATTTNAEQTKRNQKRYMTSDGNDKNKESKPLDFDFDVSYYKARHEKTLSIEAINILKTHPMMRTDDQIHTALIALNDAVEAFGEFPVNMQESLVKVGWYERYGSKRVIIRQSHAAQNFYFIISGITMVTVAQKSATSGEGFGQTVAFLKKGNSFGELALMYGGKRNATVSCLDEVELLSVTREEFIDIFMNLNTDVEPEHIQFLRDVPLLRGWPLDTLPYNDPKVCLFTYFRHGTVLCRDSNKSEWVYVIRTGTCHIVKDLPAMRDALPRLRCRTRIADSVECPAISELGEDYREFLHRDPQGRVFDDPELRRRVEAMKRKKSGGKHENGEKVFIKLRVLLPRDVFGLEPVAFDILGGTTGVTLVSDGAECVLINSTLFRKNISESYARFLRQELQPFPTMKSLEEKLQGFYNWDAYRGVLINHMMDQKLPSNDAIHY